MRTSIFLGSVFIALAIKNSSLNGFEPIINILIILFLIADTCDFFKSHSKK